MAKKRMRKLTKQQVVERNLQFVISQFSDEAIFTHSDKVKGERCGMINIFVHESLNLITAESGRERIEIKTKR